MVELKSSIDHIFRLIDKFDLHFELNVRYVIARLNPFELPVLFLFSSSDCEFHNLFIAHCTFARLNSI